MKAIKTLLQGAQTSIKAQPTTGEATNTPTPLSDFQTFGDPELEKLLAAANRFVSDIESGKPPRWLSLLGTSGVGKTMLARKIWRWFMSSHRFKADVRDDGGIVYPGQFCHWPTMTEQLKGNAGYGRLDDMRREKFVVVDEIGQSRDTSGHITEKLSVLLSCRVGKWTIVTGNLTLKDIADTLDVRIASRMIRDGNQTVYTKTKDFALRSTFAEAKFNLQ